LCINPIVYAEVSVGFARIEELDDALPPDVFTRLELPWEAGFLAGKAFVRYRRAQGSRTSPLPGFFSGAQHRFHDLWYVSYHESNRRQGWTHGHPSPTP